MTEKCENCVVLKAELERLQALAALMEECREQLSQMTLAMIEMRDRAQTLKELMPSAGLLKRLAAQAHHDYVWAKDEPPTQMATDIDEARALATRIEEAQGQEAQE